jgi:hypothetical protein
MIDLILLPLHHPIGVNMRLSATVRLWGRLAVLALACWVVDGCARGDTTDDQGQGGAGSSGSDEDATSPLGASSSTNDTSNANNNAASGGGTDTDASNAAESVDTVDSPPHSAISGDDDTLDSTVREASANDATEEGPPNAGSGGSCLPAYAQSNCLAYIAGTRVSAKGDDWLCSNGNCSNCDTYSTCAPGGTGCPWGVVWTDLGPCQ